MPNDSVLPAILSTPGAAAGLNAPLQKTESPQKIRDAAAQFESLLVGQILKSTHEEGGGWLGAGEEDQTAGSAMQMADEYFARALTANGGLGLSKFITRGLEKATSDEKATPDGGTKPSNP